MNKEKNGRLFVPAWCTRGISIAIHSILIMQISYYATESAGLSIGMIGALILAARIFDGFTDVFAGYVIDNTHTKLGKARPYELFVIPAWLLAILLFSTPDISITGKCIWIFIMYVLINAVCTTFLVACDAVFLARSTTDESRRARALTASGIACMIFPAVIAMILPILIEKWGTEPGGWTKISMAIGVPAMLFGLIRFLYVKEIDVKEEKTEKITLKTSIKCLLKNKYIWILGLAYLLCNLATNLSSVVQTYYFTYIVGNLTSMSLVGMLGLFTPLILLLFPVAMRKIGGMAFVKIGLIVAIIGGIVKYFAGANMPMLLIGTVLSGIGTTGLIMMGSIFIIQCMDYGEWKTGIRIEGMMNTIPSFAGKLGTGLASGLSGAIMGAAGYVGNAAAQTASANTAIVWCFSLIPAIICIIALITLHFYDYEKIGEKIKKEIQEKKEVK